MNPVFADTGPDSGAVAITLTIADPDGATRVKETRGVVSYVPPTTSLLNASEWNCWTDTPVLHEGERVVSLVACGRGAHDEIEYEVLYNERSSGPLYGANGSDTTRYQLAPVAASPVHDFDHRDFSAADFA